MAHYVLESEAQSLYTPLSENEIRYISLHPGNVDDPLQCNFIYGLALPDRVPLMYSALSYCWGNELASQPITLNGHPIQISKNLAAALRNLRRASGSKHMTLWADALCINQSDLEEKSVQVPRMSFIYENASQVICWPGEKVGQLEIACEKIREIVTLLPQQGLAGTPSVTPLAQLTPVVHSRISDKDWLALTHLFTLSWWSRVW